MSENWNASSAPLHPSRALAQILAPFAALAALCVVVSACASEPYSYLDGYRWNTVELNTYDTLILEVDGKSYGYNSRIRVEPGVRHILFQTRPVDGFSYSPRKELVLDVEPCTRYWFEAKRASKLDQDFEPRVNYKERIGGCTLASNNGNNVEPEKKPGGY